MLKPGDEAPSIALPSRAGGTVSLRDFKGRNLALHFFPQAAPRVEPARRPGSGTRRSSADPPEDLRTFHENLKLNFPLARDPSHGMLEAYGVWQEKNLYGAKKMGIVRTTCLLGEDGGVVRVFPRVRASGHIDEVLSALKSTRS